MINLPRWIPKYDHKTGKWYAQDRLNPERVCHLNGLCETVRSFCAGHNSAEHLVRQRYEGLSMVMHAIAGTIVIPRKRRR